jgi:hypothetical protein
MFNGRNAENATRNAHSRLDLKDSLSDDQIYIIEYLVDLE